MPSRKGKMPTMTDVAKLAGVSQSTVSLVLNGKAEDNIPHHTRLKVLQASEQLGYRPNAMARSLLGAGSGVIGCIADELVTTGFAGNIIKGAQDVAWDHRKVLMLSTVEKDRREMLNQALDAMASYRAECILYIAMYVHEVELPPIPGNIPFVLVNCYDMYQRTISFVPDDYQGAYEAMEYLVKKGHRHIGFINNNQDIPATYARENGYLHCIKDHDLPLESHYLVRCRLTGKEVFRAACEMLAGPDRPTAIMCFNDRSAIGVYNAAAHLGLSIPQDLSVIGHDDHTVVSEFLVPGLTTMRLAHYEMGHEAVRYTLSHKSPFPSEKRKFKPQLVERNSVAPLDG